MNSIKLPNVLVRIPHMNMVALCNVILYNRTMIIADIAFEESKYSTAGNGLDHHLVVNTDVMLRVANDSFIVEQAAVGVDNSFYQYVVDSKIEGIVMEDFDTLKTPPTILEVERNIQVYLEKFHLQVKASLDLMGSTYILKWFEMTDGKLGDPSNPRASVSGEFYRHLRIRLIPSTQIKFFNLEQNG